MNQRTTSIVSHLPSIVLSALIVATVWTTSFADERPNIILCMADDQGWGDVGYRDHPHLKTPILDELAANAMHFERFYAAAPVCSPTRGSVMTGRHPNRFGCFSWGYPLRPEEVTIAERLRDHGYVTGHFGKWHLGSVRDGNPSNPGESGFDVWFSAPNFYENSPILSREGIAEKTAGEGSLVTVDAALDFIRDVKDGDEPFFAVIWFGSPHQPHQAVEDDMELYADLAPPLANFYREITAMDRAIGHLRQSLREMNIADNTLLWYTSDNGALPRVGRTAGLKGRKGDLGEGGLRVPAMIEWPGHIDSPTQIDMPCSSVDILPTVLELAQIEMPDERPLDGISLVPLLNGQRMTRESGLGFWIYPARGISTPSRQIMADMWAEQNEGADPKLAANEDAWKMENQYPVDEFPGGAAWIEGRFKIHRSKSATNEDEFALYDLENDPDESEDLADQFPERLMRMRASLEAWQASVVNSLNGNDYPSQE